MAEMLSGPFVADVISVVFDGVIVHDGAAVLEVNERAAQMFGYDSRESLKGVPYSSLFSEESRKVTKTRISRRTEGCYSALCRRADGEEFPADLNARETAIDGLRARIVALRYGHGGESTGAEALVQRSLALDQTVTSLATTIEQRDTFTAGHQSRVAVLGMRIAAITGMSSREMTTIRIAGTIHDIGKIAVPAEILMKPEALTAQEYELIKIHPVKGYQIVCGIDFDGPVHEAILQHHERLDGSGYPAGLTDPIPESRVLAVADMYDALTSSRPYRAGKTPEDALAVMEDEHNCLDADALDALSSLVMDKEVQS